MNHDAVFVDEDNGVHWLAEQGLAPKRVYLVIVPLIIFIVFDAIEITISRKEISQMNNKTNTLDVLNVLLTVISNISGNIAGGALLANALRMMNVLHSQLRSHVTE